MSDEWKDPEHALAYLRRADGIPHRVAGEETLLAEVPDNARRILDLGCGDGRLLALVLLKCRDAEGVGVDYSPVMLTRAEERFHGDARVQVREHDLTRPLTDSGKFDVVCSSFAIHHLPHERKRALYREIFDVLNPMGVFCNLEHVSSPTPGVRRRFWEEMGATPEEEDPSNKLLDVESQLAWLREIGFGEVDCYWKWRELALLIGKKPARMSQS
jgi:SAM-dependent methyltransferase